MTNQWQKASLGVIAGLTIYTGFLASMVTSTKEAYGKAKEREALQEKLQQEQKLLQQLKQSLAQVQGHTVQVNKQIVGAEKNIAQLRRGTLVGGIQGASSLASSTQGVSNVNVATPPSPPQTVTGASGVR